MKNFLISFDKKLCKDDSTIKKKKKKSLINEQKNFMLHINKQPYSLERCEEMGAQYFSIRIKIYLQTLRYILQQ